MISPGRFFRLLSHDLRRGWTASRHAHRTLPRITEWKWPFWSELPQPVPVHVVVGAADWQMAAWMLASWFYFSEQAWSLVIHDDGTLPAEARAAFEGMFPKPRIIVRAESDAAMETVLKPFPFCYEYRGMHPSAQRVFDVAHYAGCDRYLLFASDVLFFNHPREILRWVEEPAGECRFNAAPEEQTLVDAKEAEDELSIKTWAKVSTGLCLITTPTIDFDFCDRALAQTSMLRKRIERVEQTLYMLCASRAGKGGLLSADYETSPRKSASPEAVARHYAGASRDRFFGEGLARLHQVLLHREE